MSTGLGVTSGSGLEEKKVSMSEVLSLLKSIEEMTHPIISLKYQVMTLETAVTEQVHQQKLLSAGLLRVEQEQRNQGGPRTPNRRRPGDDDDEEEGFPTTHKMDFPKYDGIDDPLSWLNRCERYFCVRHTLEHRRVVYALFYLTDDTQLWYHRLELNAGLPPWPRFVQLVNKRFGPLLTESRIEEQALLHRDGSIDDFAKKFMVLSYRDTAITEVHQV
jgi:hypothetical protein